MCGCCHLPSKCSNRNVWHDDLMLSIFLPPVGEQKGIRHCKMKSCFCCYWMKLGKRQVVPLATKENWPDSHLAIHDTGRVKVSQEIFHLIVTLPILHYVPMVGRNIRLKDIIHQAVQAALFRLAVLLQYPPISCSFEATWETEQKAKDNIEFSTGYGKGFTQACSLPLTKWSFRSFRGTCMCTCSKGWGARRCSDTQGSANT